MADEPTLPALPKVAWDADTQSFTNTRKRGASAHPLFSNSSDPAVFSSDDDPHVENYLQGPHRKKKRYVGSWFQQMPASSDSTFAEASEPQPRPERPFERQWDSGVWMGSDASVGLDDDCSLGLDEEPESRLPQLQTPRPAATSKTPEELLVRAKIDRAIEEGDPAIDLSSNNLSSLPDEQLSRLAELALIPSVDKDVPFQQVNPEIGLFLSNNRLTRAPGVLFNLEHLTYLSLRSNQIVELPPSIGKLRNLRELNLSLNRLRYLPGELIDLLKWPSVLTTLSIHPNPFFLPDKSHPDLEKFPALTPIPKLSIVSDTERGETLFLPIYWRRDSKEEAYVVHEINGDRICGEVHDQVQRVGHAFTWHVTLHGRSLVQYSDSRGIVISKFHLPIGPGGDHLQSEDSGENQRVTIQTVDLKADEADPTPPSIDRASAIPPQPTRVLSLYEMAAKSAAQASQTWDLASYLSPDAPSSLIQTIDRINAQSTSSANLGTVPCSTCGRQVVTPLTHWIEWWDISRYKWENIQGHQDPLSSDRLENAIPFLKRGCSWSCVPKDQQLGGIAPGTLPQLRRVFSCPDVKADPA
ncbi:hypothetical protein F4808DRAFT_37099 [Astrocystis sublimbata]|nr:hypothetical protein F4808DRAFT_37099 [Astrocystis sublimbata]